jgi:hypothetical protein
MTVKTKPTSVNLYWVTTIDHDEDWFIFAKSSRMAELYHVDYEGDEDEGADAKLIMRGCVITGTAPRNAEIRDLAKLGFEVLRGGAHGRVVRLKGRTFVEGLRLRPR